MHENSKHESNESTSSSRGMRLGGLLGGLNSRANISFFFFSFGKDMKQAACQHWTRLGI